MSTRTRKDWILWGALGCALLATAHAEYTLATAAHFNKYVALAVPGALDLYVIRALQQRRDVLAAVLAMVAANVTSHLIAGGVLAVTWHVIAAVGAVAPLIVWRVYSLKYTRNRSELVWDVNADVVSTPVLGTDTPVPDPVLVPSTQEVKAEYAYPPAPDHVPADWMDEEYPETHPSTGVLGRTKGPSPVPYLASVPDLPPEYAASAVHSDVLKESDWAFVDGAREYLEYCALDNRVPTLRGAMKHLSIGQDRADRLLAHLGVKP